MKSLLVLRWAIFCLYFAGGCASSSPSTGVIYVIDRQQPGAPAVPLNATRATVLPPQYSASRRAPVTRPTPAPRRPQTAVKTDLTGRRLVIDAGHGGKDPGAPGVGPLVEKEVNLQIARRLADNLRRYGARVIMTRNSDRFLSLDERAGIAERTRTDLFISIHADACPRPEVQGATMYVAREASAASRRAAAYLAASLNGAKLPCRGTREADFRVLVGHSRPAVLVECGYLTNRTEAYRLAQPDYQQRLVDALTAGIVRHLSVR